MDKKLLELIFDNLYNGIYIVDGRGITLGVNKTFTEMSGFSNQELVGRSLYDLVGKDNYFSGSASLLVLERKCPVTATYETSTGRKFLVKGKPLFDAHGDIEYVINTIWDLTVVQYNRQIDDDTARNRQLSEEELITCSEKMMDVIDLALRVAATDSTIMLSGESGVGKSLLAKTIHRSSERKNRPLLQINCAAIPENLIEAELFGYEAGAFTGADSRGKAGLFDMADGGTVFLDEVSELPLHLQSKLLGVIQDKEFYPVGGRNLHKVDVRLIAASNKSLEQLVSDGRFREDLYYRLNVVPITLPPLRERRADIPALIQHFTDKYNQKYNSYKKLSASLIEQLVHMPWKGNIRELENAIERCIVTSPGNQITPDKAPIPGVEKMIGSGIGLKEMLAQREAEILRQAQRQFKTTRQIAAVLGISQASVARKLQALKNTDS